jgi:hypothetical protein
MIDKIPTYYTLSLNVFLCSVVPPHSRDWTLTGTDEVVIYYTSDIEMSFRAWKRGTGKNARTQARVLLAIGPSFTVFISLLTSLPSHTPTIYGLSGS